MFTRIMAAKTGHLCQYFEDTFSANEMDAANQVVFADILQC